MEYTSKYYAKEILKVLAYYGKTPSDHIVNIRNAVRELSEKCLNIELMNSEQTSIKKYRQDTINGKRGFLVIPAKYSKTGKNIYENDEQGNAICNFAGVPTLFEHWQDIARVINSFSDVDIGSPDSDWGPGTKKQQSGQEQMTTSDWNGETGTYYIHSDTDAYTWEYLAASTAFRLHMDDSPAQLQSKWKILFRHTQTTLDGEFDGELPPSEQNESWEVHGLPFVQDELSLPAPNVPDFDNPNRVHLAKQDTRTIAYTTLVANAPKITLREINDDHSEDGLIEVGCVRENFAGTEPKSSTEIRFDLGASYSKDDISMHLYLTNRFIIPDDLDLYFYSNEDLHHQKYFTQLHTSEWIFGKTLINSTEPIAAFSILDRPNGVSVPIYWKFEGDTPVMGKPVTGKQYTVYNRINDLPSSHNAIVMFPNNVVHEFINDVFHAYKNNNGKKIYATWNGITKRTNLSTGITTVTAPQGVAQIEFNENGNTTNVSIDYSDNDVLARKIETSGPSNTGSGGEPGTGGDNGNRRRVILYNYPDGSNVPVTIKDFSVAGAVDGVAGEDDNSMIPISYNDPATGEVYGQQRNNFVRNSDSQSSMTEAYVKNNGSTEDTFTVLKNFSFIAGQERVTEESTGSENNLRTTRFGYWSDVDSDSPSTAGDPADDAQVCNGYGELQFKLNPDNSWEYFEYDSFNRISRKITPFGNVTLEFDANDKVIPPNTALCKTIEYDYSAQSDDDIVPQGETRPHRIIEKIKNIEVSRKYCIYAENEYREEICTVAGALAGAASNMVTDYITYSSGNNAGRPWKTIYPDGTMDISEYSSAGGFDFVTKSTGAPNSAKNAIVDGQQIIDKIDSAGYTVETVTKDIATNRIIDSQTYSYFMGKPHIKNYMDGSAEIKEYTCCGPVKITHRDGSTTEYRYSPDGQIVMTVKNGVATMNTYDAAGNKTSEITGPAVITSGAYSVGWPRTESLNIYNENGELITEKVALPMVDSNTVLTEDDYAVTTYSNNIVDGLWQQTMIAPDGGTIVTRYNADKSVASYSGTAVDYTVFSKTISGGEICNQKTVFYGTNSSATEKILTQFGGRVYKNVYPTGSDTITFDSAGRVATVTDRYGTTSAHQYNSRGELWRSCIIMSGGSGFGLNDRITEYQNTVSAATASAAFGVVVKKVLEYNDNASSGTVIKTIERSNWDNLEKVTEYGLTTTRQVTYYNDADEQGMNEIISYPDGSSETNSYYGGILELSSHSTLGETAFTYDGLNRLASASTNDGGTNVSTTYLYDAKGNVISETTKFNNSNSRVTSRTFDKMGRLISESLPGGRVITYTYTVKGTIASIDGYGTYKQLYTHERGLVKTMTTYQNESTPEVTTWNYNQDGMLISKVYADNNSVTYSYSNGRLSQRKWANNITTNYSYNAAGDITGITYSDSTPDISCVYDRRGRMVQVTDGAGTRTLSYTVQNLPDTESLPYYGNRYIKYEYDSCNRRSAVKVINTTDGGQETTEYQVNYTYDAMSRLASISGLNKTATYSRLNESNRISSVNFGSDYPTVNYSYDSKLRLQSKGLWNRFYTDKDEVGYMTQTGNITMPNTLDWYNYHDSKGQLTQSVNGILGAMGPVGTNYYYSYDQIGNHLAEGVTYNNVNQPSNMDYDVNGNLTDDGTYSYSYDAENRLKQIHNSYSGYEFLYDYSGKCYQRNTLYFDSDENSVQSTPEEYYVYDGTKKIMVGFPTSSSQEKYVWQPESSGDNDVILWDNDGVYSTDCNKNVIAYNIIPQWPGQSGSTSYSYTPFGELLANSSSARRFMFSSEERLGAYELYLYPYRVYHPKLKRWITRDIIEEQGGVNLYCFVNNNPFANRDNLGTNVDFSIGAAVEKQKTGKQPWHFSVSLEVKYSPLEIVGSISIGGHWLFFPKKLSQKPFKILGINVHFEAGINFLLKADVNYHECNPSSLKFCADAHAFGKAEYRMKNFRDHGKFSRFRIGASIQGGGTVCYDLCSGDITVQGDLSASVYANFGFSFFNRTYSTGVSFSLKETKIGNIHLIDCPTKNNE